jgi:multidrug efflux pump subunit AcrB
LYLASERVFRWVLDQPRTIASWVLRHRPLVLLVTIGTIVFTTTCALSFPGFFPQQDTGRLMGSIRKSSPRFQAMSRRTTEFVNADPAGSAVDNLIAFTGRGAEANTGRCLCAEAREERRAAPIR